MLPNTGFSKVFFPSAPQSPSLTLTSRKLNCTTRSFLWGSFLIYISDCTCSKSTNHKILSRRAFQSACYLDGCWKRAEKEDKDATGEATDVIEATIALRKDRQFSDLRRITICRWLFWFHYLRCHLVQWAQGERMAGCQAHNLISKRNLN